jgi:hypothetical protein
MPTKAKAKPKPKAKPESAELIMSRKELLAMVKSMPEQVNIEHLQYELHVLQTIQSRLAEPMENTISHEEVRKRLQKWLTR